MQQVRSVQLPLLLRCINVRGHEILGHLVPAVESALRVLEAVDSMQEGCVSSSVADGGSCLDAVCDRASDAESALQQLRDTLAALNRAVHHVPQPAAAIESSSGNEGLCDDAAASTVAASSFLLNDGNYSVQQGGGLLKHLVLGTCEIVTQAVASIDASSAAAAAASASAATFSSALESERSSRAAADIKVAQLQRECQNLRDEVARLAATADVASSGSSAHIQRLTSEMALLQVISQRMSDVLPQLTLRLCDAGRQRCFARGLTSEGAVPELVDVCDLGQIIMFWCRFAN